MINVLFVCLGNICRSPMAEGSFKKKIQEVKLIDKVSCDSAGTSSYHIGERPDERMLDTAERHGVQLDHFARQLTKDDFQKFDYIIAMDSKNYHNIQLMSKTVANAKANVLLMRQFDLSKNSDDVPDPYFGGMDGFEEVYDIVNRSCGELIQFIVKEHNLY